MRKGVHLVLHTIAFAGCVVAVILMIIFHGKVFGKRLIIACVGGLEAVLCPDPLLCVWFQL